MRELLYKGCTGAPLFQSYQEHREGNAQRDGTSKVQQLPTTLATVNTD